MAPNLAAMHRPVLKPWLIATSADNALGFRYGDRALVVRGRATAAFLPELLSLLDGTRTVSELQAAVTSDFASAVPNALELLAKHGLIYDNSDGAHDGESQAVDHFFFANEQAVASPSFASGKLRTQHVALIGSGPAREVVETLLRQSGVGGITPVPVDVTQEALGAFTLALAIPSAAEMPYMDTINMAALAADLPWLQVLPFDGTLTAIGPLYIPYETCCYACYVQRRETAAGMPQACAGPGACPAERPELTTITTMAASLAATVALRWMVTSDATIPGELYALEYHPAPSVTRHRVFRLPRCATCSPIARLSIPDVWSTSLPPVTRNGSA